MLRRFAGAALAVVALAACGGPAVEPDSRDPVASARAAIELVKSRRCEEAWRFVSAATQRRIEERSRLEIRRAPYYVASFAPHQLLCGHTAIGEYRPDSLRLVSASAERAVVAAVRPEVRDFLIPGFFPTSTEDVPGTLALVREGDRWRLDLVVGAPNDPVSGRDVTTGKITFRSYDHGGTTIVWVEGEAEAPVAAIEAVVMRASQWPRLLPWVEQVDFAPDAKGERGDWRLTLRLRPRGGAPVAAALLVRSYATVAARRSCCFGVGVAPLDDASSLGNLPLVRLDEGWLVAYPDGEGRTRVQLGYRFARGGPPADVVETLRSPDALAALFRTLAALRDSRAAPRPRP